MKLEPAIVPWSISACDEIVDFNYDINAPHIYITVVCNFSDYEKQRRIDEYIKINGKISESTENSIGIDLIKLKFDDVAFFSVYNQPGTLLESEKRYDMSLLSEICSNAEYYHELWNKKGVCPVPGLYKVIDPIYNDILKIDKPDYIHWLITISSEQQEIYIISKKFSWEVIDKKMV